MDLVLKVRDELSLESNITTALYGVVNQSRAEKALEKAYTVTLDIIGQQFNNG